MFDKDRYLTRGVSNEVTFEIQLLLWSMIGRSNSKEGLLTSLRNRAYKG